MTRMQQFNEEVRQIISGNIRANMPEVSLVDASFCNDLPNEFFSYSWSDFKIAKGKLPIAKWISDNGFVVCKKSEATCLLRVGERCIDTNYWIIGSCKNYWLKNRQIN